MGYEHHGLAGPLLGQTAQDDGLVQAVEVACRFVQKNERCIVQKCPRHTEPLPLAAREGIAQLPDGRVVALRQRHDKVVDGRLPAGCHDLLMGRVPVGNFDILFNTVMEQHGVLLDEALRCAQRRRVDALDVLAGDLDLS